MMIPAPREESPIVSLERQMGRMMDRFFREFGWEPPWLGGERTDLFSPRVNVSETDTEIKVTAELPGLEEKDLDVTLARDSLIIQGEKREEREDKKRDYYRMECSYGSFRRVIPLPVEVNADKAEAKFRKGVLTITLPKVETEVKEHKKIEVKTEG